VPIIRKRYDDVGSMSSRCESLASGKNPAKSAEGASGQHLGLVDADGRPQGNREFLLRRKTRNIGRGKCRVFYLGGRRRRIIMAWVSPVAAASHRRTVPMPKRDSLSTGGTTGAAPGALLDDAIRGQIAAAWRTGMLARAG
jgi:hypothetical protein